MASRVTHGVTKTHDNRAAYAHKVGRMKNVRGAVPDNAMHLRFPIPGAPRQC